MPIAELPAEKARELVHVKVVAPTMLTRATVPGMIARGDGTIINVAGMIAFSGPAPQSLVPRRAVYAGTLAHTVAMTRSLQAELEGTGVRVQVVRPGVVATEFHERQGSKDTTPGKPTTRRYSDEKTDAVRMSRFPSITWFQRSGRWHHRSTPCCHPSGASCCCSSSSPTMPLTSFATRSPRCS